LTSLFVVLIACKIERIMVIGQVNEAMVMGHVNLCDYDGPQPSNKREIYLLSFKIVYFFNCAMCELIHVRLF